MLLSLQMDPLGRAGKKRDEAVREARCSKSRQCGMEEGDVRVDTSGILANPENRRMLVTPRAIFMNVHVVHMHAANPYRVDGSIMAAELPDDLAR